MKITGTAVEQKILKAAQVIFLRYGFHATTLRQIAVNAEVNKSIIHYYFRSKEKLYMRILENVIEYIETADFTNENFQEENLKVKWFLSTEIYNNNELFMNTLKQLFSNNLKYKLYFINKWLEYISIYHLCN